jgi:hypothetical protein
MSPLQSFHQTPRTCRAHVLAAAIACITALPLPAPAANITTTWIGNSDDWQDPANWTYGVPQNDPLNSYLPIINFGYVTLATNLTTSGLYLAQNSRLTLTANNTYTVLPCDFGNTGIYNSQISLQSGATLNLSAAIDLANTTISGPGTLNIFNGLYLDPSNVISQGAHIVVSPAATLSLGDYGWTTIDNAVILNQGFATINPRAYTTTFFELANGATLTNAGTMSFSSSAFSNWTLAADSNTANAFLNTGLCSFSNSDFSTLTISAPITNTGALALANSNFSSLTISALITNTGTLSLANSGLLTISAPFTNSGTLALANSGLLTISGPFTNTGILSLANSTKLSLSSGGTLSGAINFAGSGTITAANSTHPVTLDGVSITGTSPTFSGTFALAHENSAEYFSPNSSVLTGPGTLTVSKLLFLADSATISQGAHIVVSPSGTLSFAGSRCTINNAAIFNQGLATLNPAVFQLANGAIFTNAGTMSFTSSSISNWALAADSNTANAFLNTGTLSIANFGISTLAISAPLTNTGTLSITNSNISILTISAPVTNSGTLALANSGLSTLTISAPFTNSGTLALANSGLLTISGPFTNTGLFSFSASDWGSLTISAPFYNSGTVTISKFDTYAYGPNFVLAGGGSSSGLFNAPNGTIKFSAPYTLNSATLSCAGINTAPLALLGNNVVTGFSIGHNLLGSGTLTGGGFDWTAGTISNAGGLHINASATISTYVSQAPFTYFPANFVFFTGYADLPGKTLDGTTLTLDSDCTAAAAPRLRSGDYRDSIALNNGAQIINNGTFVDFLRSLTFNNLDNHPNNAFINNGRLSFSEINGSLTFNVPFYNTGTLALTPAAPIYSPQAPFLIAGGGSASGLILTSTFFYPANISHTGIRFSAPYTLANATLSGMISATAPLTLLGNVRATGLSLLHNLLGPGTLTGSALSWSTGTISNAGGIFVNASNSFFFRPWNDTSFLSTSFLLLASTPTTPLKTLDGTTLTITPACSAAFAPANLTCRPDDTLVFQNGAQILNHGAFYTFLPNPSFTNADNHPNNAFINTGTFGRHALSSTSNADRTTFLIPFHNSGLIDIQQGQIDFAGGFFNDAPITSNTANFHFAPNTGLYFSGGTYDFGTAPFDLGLGGLAGTGTVRGNFTSAGTIAPGNSPDTLTISGALALANSATTALDIDAADPANPHADLLSIAGTFFADGTLSVTLLNPLPSLPSLPDAPLTLISASTFLGTFLNAPNNSRLTDTTGNTSFLVTYTPTSLLLSDFQPIPEPASLLLLAPTLLLLRRRK